MWTAVRIDQGNHVALPPNVGTNFADKRLSLGRYISLTDSGHEVQFSLVPHVVSAEIEDSSCRQSLRMAVLARPSSNLSHPTCTDNRACQCVCVSPTNFCYKV
jgi:hypothetical protein